MKVALTISVIVHVVIIYTISFALANYIPVTQDDFVEIPITIVPMPIVKDQQTILDEQQFEMDEQPIVVICPVPETEQ